MSGRLTGGSAQANCLSTDQSAGLNEGWSDAMAIFLTRKQSDSRDDDAYYATYTTNKPHGMRDLPYSTNLDKNPRKFSYVGTATGPHAMGEYWANVLFEMYWNLVDLKGFSTNWYDATQDKGNIIALQLVIGGLKLQPCNPTFLKARDAILAADQSYYKGEFKCEIWKAFAKRGMGVDATANFPLGVYKDNDKSGCFKLMVDNPNGSGARTSTIHVNKGDHFKFMVGDTQSILKAVVAPVLCNWWSWGCTFNDDGMS